MIRIQQIKMEPDHTMEELEKKILSILRIKRTQIEDWKIVKCSIDARRKPFVKKVYSVDIKAEEEELLIRRIRRGEKDVDIGQVTEQPYHFPPCGKEKLLRRPVVVGSGPAGLFCGLFLAEHGYRPLVLERGEEVDARTRTVAEFWEGKPLKLFSNVQFGEGGAGTFSDGKLNTLVKDSNGRNRKVLEVFVEAGAPEEILYLNKAHIGTDILRNVVKQIRKRIEQYGGEVRFLSQVTDIEVVKGILQSLIVNGRERIPCQAAVLAIGHSARDTFTMLQKKAIAMSAKSFAVGVRIEHPQTQINLAQYGVIEKEGLLAADYKVTYQASNGRSVYSFCMCPGGYVVNASSEEGRIAVNGMSNHRRDGENANSALIVSVTPKDFEGDSPLSGMEFQRRLEEAAYLSGEGKIPLQLFGDFKRNRKSERLGAIRPNLKGAYSFANLREVFPLEICEALEEGIFAFGKKISEFDREDAILSGVESRTSSPVRIWRNKEYESSIAGIYPCGEGAGYAGGITSAAMDGIKVAEMIAKKYAPFDKKDEKKEGKKRKERLSK